MYGQPALAAPLNSLQATATVSASRPGSGLLIRAPDIAVQASLADAAAHALALTAQLTLEHLHCAEPDAEIEIRSSIPIASGLGSGAAVSAALARALAGYLARPLDPGELSSLVYEVEKIHHGTPSGIDNTVICYNMPVYFIKDREPETFRAACAFGLVIADTGKPSPTREAVRGVRSRWEADRTTYERLFQHIGQIANQARAAIEHGDLDRLGALMNENHSALRAMGVSSPELEKLISRALSAGATGAKLSGGGQGGNMIALVDVNDRQKLKAALKPFARQVLYTEIGGPGRARR